MPLRSWVRHRNWSSACPGKVNTRKTGIAAPAVQPRSRPCPHWSPLWGWTAATSFSLSHSLPPPCTEVVSLLGRALGCVITAHGLHVCANTPIPAVPPARQCQSTGKFSLPPSSCWKCSLGLCSCSRLSVKVHWSTIGIFPLTKQTSLCAGEAKSVEKVVEKVFFFLFFFPLREKGVGDTGLTRGKMRFFWGAAAVSQGSKSDQMQKCAVFWF